MLDYTQGTAACHARLIARARRTGKPRRTHDLIIAAHALQSDRIILAFDANARFSDLPGVNATALQPVPPGYPGLRECGTTSPVS